MNPATPATLTTTGNTNKVAHPANSLPEAMNGVDLRTILRILNYWRWLLLVGLLVGAGLGYGVSLQSIPVYRAEMLMLIEETRPLYSTNLNEVNLAGRTSTYLELINQGLMLEDVAEQLQLDFPQLRDSVTDMRVEQVRNTQLFNIYVEGYFPDYVAVVANAIPRVLTTRLSDARGERFAASLANLTTQLETIKAQVETTQANIDRIGVARTPQQENQLNDLQTVLAQQQNSYANLVQSYENLRLLELQSMDNIAVIRPAEVPDGPMRANTVSNILLGALVGIALVLTVIALIEYLDDRIQSPQALQLLLGTTVLGAIDIIPDLGNRQELSNSLITAIKPRHPITEAYRSIRTNLRFSAIDTKLHALLVTSSNPGEGKSVTAANLAIAMAQFELSVILIDADLRKPMVHKLFQLAKQPGLSETLLDETNPQRYLQEVGIPNLRVMTSGQEPPNPAELLGSQRMGRLIEQLYEAADVLIFDTPPVLAVTDAAVLAAHVPDVVLVVNAKRTQRSAAMRATEALHRIDARLLGVVINELSRSSRSYSYYGDYQSAGYYGDSN